MAQSAPFTRQVDLAAFFREAKASFARAARQPLDRFYRIADLPVCLRFAHEGLCKHLTQSLSHLEEKNPLKGAFTISIFDTASSGEKLNAPDWLLGGLSARGELLLPPQTPYRAVLNTSTSILTLLDEEANCGLFFAENIEKLPPWEIGAPFLALLHLFLKKHQIQVVHAAAVGLPNGKSALLVGAGGAGKSTTAISCLFSGMLYLGDDYTAISMAPPYQAYSLYCSGKLTPFSLRLLKMNVSEEEQKTLLFFGSSHKELLSRSSQLSALVLPCVSQSDTPSCCEISSAEMLRAFLPSCMMQLPYSNEELFTQTGALVRSLPCFKVTLGKNPKGNADVIRELL